MGFETIDIDRYGYMSVIKPNNCIDYHSSDSEFDFIGKNKKILLRLKSKHIAHAHNAGYEIYYNLQNENN